VIRPQVKLDATALDPVTEKLKAALEDQLTSAMQTATDTVDHDYAGETVEEVAAELVEATKNGLHPDIADGFSPNPSEVRAVATAIVEDNE
jgi:hypothetical protein